MKTKSKKKIKIKLKINKWHYIGDYRVKINNFGELIIQEICDKVWYYRTME